MSGSVRPLCPGRISEPTHGQCTPYPGVEASRGEVGAPVHLWAPTPRVCSVDKLLSAYTTLGSQFIVRNREVGRGWNETKTKGLLVSKVPNVCRVVNDQALRPYGPWTRVE